MNVFNVTLHITSEGLNLLALQSLNLRLISPSVIIAYHDKSFYGDIVTILG